MGTDYDDLKSYITDLYARTEKADKENALNAQRIELHERECIQKHEAVLSEIMDHKKEVRRFIQYDFKPMDRKLNKFFIAMLISVLGILVMIWLRPHIGN